MTIQVTTRTLNGTVSIKFNSPTEGRPNLTRQPIKMRATDYYRSIKTGNHRLPDLDAGDATPDDSGLEPRKAEGYCTCVRLYFLAASVVSAAPMKVATRPRSRRAQILGKLGNLATRVKAS